MISANVRQKHVIMHVLSSHSVETFLFCDYMGVDTFSLSDVRLSWVPTQFLLVAVLKANYSWNSKYYVHFDAAAL